MDNLLAANTEYCILVESDNSLNVTCTGDPFSTKTTTSPLLSTVTSAEITQTTVFLANVNGFSECYRKATANSIPVALLCFNNQATGSQIVIDGSRAKESSTKDCQCKITSDNATQLNFSSYSNIQPGVACGSTVSFVVGWTYAPQNCFVSNVHIPYAPPTLVEMENVLSANTDYCIFVESDNSLNVSCTGDQFSMKTTTSRLLSTVTSAETTQTTDAAESTEVSTFTISYEQQKSTTTLPPNLSVFVTPQSDTTATNGGTISSTWKNSDTSVPMGLDRGTGFNVEDPNFIFGVVGAVVAIGIVVTVSMLIIRRRRAECKQKIDMNVENDDNQYAEIDSLPNFTTFSEIPQTYENEVAKEASKAVKNPTDGNIMIPDLLSKIISLEKDSRMGFTEEFRSISPKLDISGTSNEQLQQDISQNRFSTTVSHEKSRVHLQDASCSKYCNANFIKNTFGKRAYIASQGPSRETVHRFWQLVWQERLTVIVDLEENKGGEQYWPYLLNGECRFGSFHIRLNSKKDYANFALHKLELYHERIWDW
uniref:protein-tyrosine-phosphatase n=1 Tax=Crassostrea virginica TaxID=6565 RepID=A0A8B8AD90_CRAVI|nr:receptor-type tyrosine-protein phosphatase alpha-like [Crassostrea virginica]